MRLPEAFISSSQTRLPVEFYNIQCGEIAYDVAFDGAMVTETS